ncbi:MAG: CD1247 N-terminal domain-containing protein [Bacillota bacterium]
MRDLKSRVAYLQGLSAGMNIENESKEGRILNNIIQVLDDFANTIKEMEEAHNQLEDYLESIDEDLFHLEEDLYNDTDTEEDAEEYLEVDCPRCGEVVCFDSDILEDEDTIEVTCPNCDEVVFINDDNFQAADEPEQIEGRMAVDDDL